MLHDGTRRCSMSASITPASGATAFVSADVMAQLCDALGPIGMPAYCAQRLLEMIRAGVTRLSLMPLQTFAGPEQSMHLS
jgi:hypothetical protein